MVTAQTAPFRVDLLNPSVISLIRRTLLLAGAYFLADAVLNKFALGDGWQIFWPLNGVTVALLIMRPRRQWPLLLGAISLGTGLGEFIDDNTLVATLVERAFSVLEVTLSAMLLPPFTGLEAWLTRPGLYPRFAAAVVLGPVISGVLAAVYLHAVVGTPLLSAFSSWALADAMGIAAVLPVVLAICSRPRNFFENGPQGLRAAGTLILATLVMGVIFATNRYPLIFVLYPLLMLVDWVLGLLGSSLALLLGCVIAVFLTEHGYGPFANPIGLGMSRNLAVQAYLGFHLIGFLPISILFLQQRRMDRDLRESLAKTAMLASLDGLTGVANRRALDIRLEEQWHIAARDRTPLALLMVDADNFKEFNDRLGHQAGDTCLRALATALEKHISRPADLVARFGGEEFAVLLPNTMLQGARQVAESLREAVRALAIAHPGNHAEGFVTVSIGCAALTPAAGEKLSMLVEMADEALYEAKRSGRDRVCHAEPDRHVWKPGSAARRLRDRVEALRAKRRG